MGQRGSLTPPLPQVTKLPFTDYSNWDDAGSLCYKNLGRWLLKVPSRIKNYLSPPRVDALSVSDTDESSLSQSSEEDSDVAEHEQQRDVAKKEKVGFRNRKIIEYENRIRQYSTPDKVFRYFATLVHAHTGEVFMTPADFLRSITPGIQQPEGLGLDQFQRFDPSREKIVLNLPADSIFYHLGSAGLISFSDYIFLLTVLSTSKRHFEIAFQMFDLNGDGDVDAEEFSAVESLLLQNSSIGSKHRDHGSAGTISKGSAASSALSKFFFGPDLREKLTIERFLEFHEQLQREILTLEFQRKDSNRKGTIKPRDFADLLVAYSGFARKKRAKMLKRVSRYFKAEDKKDIELDLEDYLKFFQFVNCIDDVDTALTFYHIAGASINPETFKHVARTVSQVELPDNVVEVIFVLFDEDGDGELSNREFVSVMKRRIQRGLEKSKDTGFIRLLRAMAKCVAQGTPAVLNG
ncbi:unnamed protein product [Cyprideis torosa]|uniref:Uncharacterized protein n=1 Tax=Cyprideis torosa TaxID=163714 RepID=A0A7R8ZNB4_9CRUS|nr:unnamed protein product [Cyprideis torosa]CAG0887489.1 unnamed protein product [Cyprideis torosa]